jgi:hypothetical protein
MLQKSFFNRENDEISTNLVTLLWMKRNRLFAEFKRSLLHAVIHRCVPMKAAMIKTGLKSGLPDGLFSSQKSKFGCMLEGRGM